MKQHYAQISSILYRLQATVLTAAVLLAAALLVSCENSLVPKPAAPAESGGGEAAGGGILVTIKLPGAESSARTAMPDTPDYAELDWTVTASDGARTVQSQGTYPNLTIALPYEGTWTFTVSAADAGREIYYGQTPPQTITHGSDNTVTVVLGPGASMQNGEGSISLEIQTAPDTNIAAVYYKLEPTGSTTEGGVLTVSSR